MEKQANQSRPLPFSGHFFLDRKGWVVPSQKTKQSREKNLVFCRFLRNVREKGGDRMSGALTMEKLGQLAREDYEKGQALTDPAIGADSLEISRGVRVSVVESTYESRVTAFVGTNQKASWALKNPPQNYDRAAIFTHCAIPSIKSGDQRAIVMETVQQTCNRVHAKAESSTSFAEKAAYERMRSEGEKLLTLNLQIVDIDKMKDDFAANANRFTRA